MVLKVEFEKNFENEFRELAMKKYGFSKGSIKLATGDAIKKWIREQNKNLPNIVEPIRLVRGIMKNFCGKYTSVELQHETTKLWIKKT